MRILKEQQRTITEELIDKILCNGCEKELDDGAPGGWSPCVGTFDFSWGSGYDGNLSRIDLCDDCYNKFYDSLKIKPEELR